MRLARVRHNGQVWLARVEEDSVVLIREESDHPSADALREAIASDFDLSATGKTFPTTEVDVLAPVINPSKFLCVGLNYADHVAEAGVEVPTAPVIFAKYANTIIGPADRIHYWEQDSSQVDFEAELGVVIGSHCSRVSADTAMEHVFGYTVVNDISARDAQFADGQWTRGKSFDCFAPLGPTIVTRDEVPDVQQLGVRCYVNGESMQSGNTSDMIFGVAELVSYISRYLTLIPGDLIATGTPAGVGFTRSPPVLLKDGDVVVTEIPGIGRLTNRIATTASSSSPGPTDKDR